MNVKCDIFRRYAEWKANGSRRDESPIVDLVQEYGCNRGYPKALYDKCLETGSVDSNFCGGRPVEFNESFFEQHMVPMIREFRSRQKTASVRKITATIKKKRRTAKAPSISSVRRAKKKLGFRKHKVKKKPKLSANLWAQRLKMAKERRGSKSVAQYIKDHERTVMGDEKWSSEEKGNQLDFEARKASPVPVTVRFVAKDAETRTQLIKIMFLLCVTSTQPIGFYELDFKTWNAEKGQKTKAGKDAKGITAAFMKPILKKVAKDARKKLGAGPITFLHDKAPCYQALVAEGDNCGFDGVCKVMEDAVEAEGAETADEIRAAVKKAWKQITPEFLRRVSECVYKNMGEVIRLKGGNFYDEAKTGK